jgi:hypothetical protein
MSEELTDFSTEKATWRFWSRLIGSLAILALVFWIVPGQMPTEIRPPAFNEANLNAVQEEGRKTLMEGRTRQAKGTVVTVVGGVPMYSYQGRRPTKERPKWLDNNNQPTLTTEDKEKLSSRYEFPAPDWMHYGGRTVTYAEHNAYVGGSQFFGFLGLLTSVALYFTFFWFFPGRRKMFKTPKISIVWVVLMATFFGYFVPNATITTSLFWPLVLFGVPMAAMFLLWAVTRSSKDEEDPDVVEGEESALTSDGTGHS